MIIGLDMLNNIQHLKDQISQKEKEISKLQTTNLGVMQFKFGKELEALYSEVKKLKQLLADIEAAAEEVYYQVQIDLLMDEEFE